MRMASCKRGGFGSMGLRGGEKVQFMGSKTGDEGKTRDLTSANGNETDDCKTSGWKRRVARYERAYTNGGGERDAKYHKND
jgi:hypothetical protein